LIYDVIIIGGGVTGCTIARTLSKYDLKICLLEKEADIASGTTKANSGVVKLILPVELQKLILE